MLTVGAHGVHRGVPLLSDSFPPLTFPPERDGSKGGKGSGRQWERARARRREEGRKEGRNCCGGGPFCGHIASAARVIWALKTCRMAMHFSYDTFRIPKQRNPLLKTIFWEEKMKSDRGGR